MSDHAPPNTLTAKRGGFHERMQRGAHPADPRRLGSLVGLVGGVVFVLAYSGVLSSPWSWLLNGVAVVLAAACVWRLFLRPLPMGEPQRPHRLAGLIYLAAVAAMVAAIFIGRTLLEGADRTDVAPAVIAFAVGCHFAPFAVAFRERMLMRLAVTVGGVGLVGMIVAWLAGPPVGAVAAVAAGFAQLAVIAQWAFSAGGRS